MTEVAASIPTLRSSSRPAPRKTNAAIQWLPPVGLITLSLIPVLAGAFRLNELMGSPEITAENARFVASPIPVTVHIVSVTVYSLLGALQFVPLLRRGRQNWHHIAGRILVPAGVLVALSGLWMNFSIRARRAMASRSLPYGSSSAWQCWRASCWLFSRYDDETSAATARG
jgi:Predicted membrane protein (DUF2306)